MNKKLALLAIAVTISIIFGGINSSILYSTQYMDSESGYRFSVGSAVSWWNCNWSYSKKITIDHTKVALDQTDYTVLLKRDSDSDLADYAQNNGYDIVFVDESNSTQYRHEIESFNDATGALTAWVKLTSISSTRDTILYMYYGNPTCDNQQNISGTWNSGFKMVQHLNQDAGTLYDSTNNDNDGANNGAEYTSSSKINGGYDFDGGDNITVSHSDSLNITGSITLEGWVKDPPWFSKFFKPKVEIVDKKEEHLNVISGEEFTVERSISSNKKTNVIFAAVYTSGVEIKDIIVDNNSVFDNSYNREDINCISGEKLENIIQKLPDKIKELKNVAVSKPFILNFEETVQINAVKNNDEGERISYILLSEDDVYDYETTTHLKINHSSNFFTKSFVDTTLIESCFLSSLSLDHIGQLNLSDNAKKSTSSGSGDSFFAFDKNSLYSSFLTKFIVVSRNFTIREKCSSDKEKRFNISDLYFSNSVNANSGEYNINEDDVDSSRAFDFSLKKENKMLVSTTNRIQKNPCFLSLSNLPFLNSRPSFTKSLSLRFFAPFIISSMNPSNFLRFSSNITSSSMRFSSCGFSCFNISGSLISKSSISNTNISINSDSLNSFARENIYDFNQECSEDEIIEDIKIIDKKEEHLNVISGEEFTVERSISSNKKTNVIFAAVYTSGIEIKDIIVDNNSVFDNSYNREDINCISGEKLENIIQKLPDKIKELKNVAVSKSFILNLQEKIQINAVKNNDEDNRISYILLSEDGIYDFETTTHLTELCLVPLPFLSSLPNFIKSSSIRFFTPFISSSMKFSNFLDFSSDAINSSICLSSRDLSSSSVFGSLIFRSSMFKSDNNINNNILNNSAGFNEDDKKECIVYEKTNTTSQINNFSSSVENISTQDCCLNLFSLDHIAEFNDNASAKYGMSFECPGKSFCASFENISYFFLDTTLMFLNKSFIKYFNSVLLSPEKDINLSIRPLVSSRIYSGEYNSKFLLGSKCIKSNNQPCFIKQANMTLASTTSFIYVNPCRLAIPSFTSFANSSACSSVNLDLETILRNCSISFSCFNRFNVSNLTISDQFTHENLFNSDFIFSDSVIVTVPIYMTPFFFNSSNFFSSSSFLSMPCFATSFQLIVGYFFFNSSSSLGADTVNVAILVPPSNSVYILMSSDVLKLFGDMNDFEYELNNFNYQRQKPNTVEIVDKKEEHLNVIAGQKFTVQRTLSSNKKTTVVFAAVHTPGVEIKDILFDNTSVFDYSYNRDNPDFNENRIENIIQNLPDKIKELEFVAVSKSFILDSEKKVQINALVTDERNLKDGRISYILLSEDGVYDFETTTHWKISFLGKTFDNPFDFIDYIRQYLRDKAKEESVVNIPEAVKKNFERNQETQVMLQFKDKSVLDEKLSKWELEGFEFTTVLYDEGIIAGRLDKDFYEKIKFDYDIKEVVEDNIFSVLLDESLPLINYNKTFDEFGLTGENIRIAILDTGVNPTYIDYSVGYNFVDDSEFIYDYNGHGTRVASVIQSIAPKSKLIVAKVIDDAGVGYESTVIQGLKWVVEQDPDIILFSIGTKSVCSGFCDSNILADLCNQYVDEGIFVVAASGNTGSKVGIVGPACGSNVFSVGATDNFDSIAGFSNVNPILDLFAPGVDIKTNAGVASGTSMSAPFVAGAAALILENEDLNPVDLKNRFKSTGVPISFIFNDSLSLDIARLDLYNAVVGKETMAAFDYTGWWQSELEDKTYETLADWDEWEDELGVTWYIVNITSGSSDWVVPAGVTKIDVLLVAGGGGSGKGTITTNQNAGGGGAGGLVWIRNVTRLGEIDIEEDNTIKYSVGSGGAGSTDVRAKGSTGSDSNFGNLTAKGGGGGGSSDLLTLDGVNGGSGGGAGVNDRYSGSGGTGTQPSQSGWSGTYGYGNNGANSGRDAGGGGGAGSAGGSMIITTPGGDGLDMRDYFGTSWGNSGVFASGGGAQNYGSDAVANSGMGGRARATNDGGNGRAGGSGIILIRWEKQAPFPDGDGSEADPYQITHIDHLYAVRDYLWANFTLMNDLDFTNLSHYLGNEEQQTQKMKDNTSGKGGWLPIGSSSPYFSGSLNGNNYTISNLFINRSSTSSIGLFGRITSDASIYNLGLLNVNITGSSGVCGLAASNYGDIYNCYVTGEITGISAVCGIAGRNDGDISKCYSKANITGTGSFIYYGGLVGRNYGGSISDCYATGSVTAETGGNVGGLAGANHNGGYINNSYSTGPVTGSTNVGGLVGINDSSINNCFYDSDTSGHSDTGKGEPKTTNEMKTLSTFDNAGWDISTSNTDLNSGYPYLAWQNETDTNIWLIYEISETPPYATNVSISSTYNFTLDDLTGSYDYNDNQSDAESGTSYEWYTNESGSWVALNVNSTTLDSNYTNESSWYKFEVTPRNANGAGSPVNSSAVQIVPFNQNLALPMTYSGTYNEKGNITVQNTGSASLGISGTLTLEGKFSIKTASVSFGNNNHSLGSLEVGGTCTGSSGTIYITNEDSNGYAVNLDGAFNNNSGTVQINTTDATKLDLTCESGGIYDLVINAGSTVSWDGNTNIGNTLHINSGTFLPNSAGDTLTVKDGCSIETIGDINGSTASGAWSFKYLQIKGAFTATTGVTTITGKTGGNYAFDNAGTFTHNRGTFTFTGDGDNHYINVGSDLFGNLNLNEGGSSTNYYVKENDLTVDNNLVVNCDALLFYGSGSRALTVNGATTINNGATLKGRHDASYYASAVEFKTLTIDSGGAYWATSGTTTMNGNLANSGTFSHKNGKVVFDANAQVSGINGDNKFYKLDVNAGKTLTVAAGNSLDAENEVLINGSLNCNNGQAHSFGSLDVNSGGTYSATAGTTSITSEAANGYALDLDGTFTHNSGTIEINTESATNIDIASTGNLYNLIIDTNANTVTHTATATVANNITVQSGKLLSNADLTTKEMQINSNAEFEISSSTFTMTGQPLTLNGFFNITTGEAIDINLSSTKFKLQNANNIGLHKISDYPSNPSGFDNISKYVNLSAIGSSPNVNINISYSDSDLGSLTESTLIIKSYNETTHTWSTPANTGKNTDTNWAWANDVTSFSIFGILGKTLSTPTVTTNASTGVEETNATLRGYLTSNGSADTTCGFWYDTTSGEKTNNQSVGVISQGNTFSYNATGLTPGQLYYFTAWANNSQGFVNGSEFTFLTKPQAPTSFTAQTNNSNTIYLTWTKGSGANNTRIQQKTGSYPTSITDGTNVYNDTGTHYENNSLEEGTTYYYRAWSYATWNPHQWSDENASTYNTTNNKPTIELRTPSPNGTTGVSLTPQCSIYANDTDGHTLNIYWYENTTGDYTLRNTNNSITANSTVNYTYAEFNSYSTTYYWKVFVNDGMDNVSKWFYFTTDEEPNVAPWQHHEGPNSGSTNQCPPVTLNVTCTDNNTDEMDAAWWSNSSGSWLQFASNTSINTGSSIQQTNSNFTNPGTKYWWSVNLTDGELWNNQTYSFTTNYKPQINFNYPSNNSVEASTSPNLSITVTDNDGDPIDVTIYSDTDSEDIISWNDQSSGTALSHKWWTKKANTEYTLYVNASDGCTYNNVSWIFTTRETYLNDSAEIWEDGKTYYIDTDIYDINASKGFIVSGPNITLNGQGYTIDGLMPWGYEAGFYTDQSNTTIKNCRLTNWSGYTIEYENVDNGTIENITINDTVDTYGDWRGILLNECEYTIINNVTISNINNSVEDQTIIGIYIYNAESINGYNTISNFSISDLDIKDAGGPGAPTIIGIQMYETNNNTISNGNINHNHNSATVYGIWLYENNNPGDFNTITNTTITNEVGNGYGIMVYNVDNTTISNCTINKYSYGIYFTVNPPESLNDNTIKNTKITNNTDSGITMGPSINTNIYNNYFNNSGTNGNINIAIEINNIWNTTEQPGTRIYSNGPNIGGNFWTNATGTGYSDTCTDADNDGFCDDPYVLAKNNTDYLPYSTQYSAKNPPTVTTNTSTGITATNATLWGYLSDDGGEACTLGFRYGTTSGSYTQNFSIPDTHNTGKTFSNNNESLEPGQIYYYQAWANNTAGFSNGSETIFLTKPQAPTSFHAQTNNSNTIYLTWTKGNGANNTRIQQKTGSYPTSITDGTNVYNDTGTHYENNSLEEGTTYYYRAWSYATWNPHQWSDENASTYNTTNNKPTIELRTPSPNGTTDVSLTPQCSIYANDTDGHTLNIYWYENTTGDYTLRNTNNTINANSTVNYTYAEFNSYSTTYYWKVFVNDGMDNISKWFYFTTKDNQCPTTQGENPTNETTGICINTLSTINVTIEDPDGDNFNWTIQTSPNIGSNNANSATNGSKTCSVSGMQPGTTYTWYVNVTDGNCSINKWYQFTTNNNPTQTGESPSDTSTEIPLTPALYVICSDADSDTMTATWRSNSSGSWATFATNSSISTGTNITQTNTNFSTYSTKYWWSVNLTDGCNWTNATYSFTTKTNTCPSSNSESPSNKSTGESINIGFWNITITDTDGHTTTGTITCSNGNHTSWNTQANGTKSLTLNTLNYNTNYTIWLNFTDSHCDVNETFWFITMPEPNQAPYQTGETPSNESTGICPTPSLHVTCIDNDDDTMNATWWSNSSGSWLQFASNTSFANNTNITQTDTNFSAPGTTYYWSVNLTDGCNWTNTTYSFTTNYAPTQSGETPSDTTTKVCPIPSLHVICSDADLDTMTATWWSNSSDIWQQFATNNSINSGTNITQTNTNFSAPGTTYYWSVNLTDGCNWTNTTYSFTTNYAPTQSGEVPKDAATEISPLPDLYLIISDIDGDTLTVTWRSNSSGSWATFATNNSVASGTNITQNNTNFSSYSTKYYWSVNLTDGCNWTNQTYSFTTIIQEDPPIVTTNASTGVEETNATLRGYLISDGNVTTTVGFWYDTTSGGKTNNATVGTLASRNTFSYNATGLTPGQFYYFTAWANNSEGFVNGSEFTFLTKPNAPTSFTAQTNSSNTIYLTWTKGTGANYTRIQQKTGSYPTSITDGTNVYNGTGTQKEITGLEPGTTYYYRAWSYATWNPHQWSEGYNSTSNTTYNAPSLSAELPTNESSSIPLNPTLQITVNHNDSYLMNITWYWGTDSSCPNFIGTNSSVGNGTYYMTNDANFSLNSQTYYWKVTVNDGHGAWTNETYHFTTIGANKGIISKGQNAYSLEINPGGDTLYGYINGNLVNTSIDTNWHYVSLTYDGSTIKLYKDGVLVDSTSYSGSINTNANDLLIGEYMTGTLDELRVSSTARSAAWINTTYINTNEPTTFATFGTQVGILSTFSYRKQIWVNSSMVDSDLSDFPVLVSITDTDLKNNADASGYDIIFTSSEVNWKTGTYSDTLPHEIEKWDSSTGELVCWVKLDSISSTANTSFYMYYSSICASDKQDAENVWDSNFKAVWHMSDTSDSTANNNDGTNNGADLTSNGKINNAFDFEEGNGDYINVSDSSSMDITNTLTLESWFKLESQKNYHYILEKHGAGHDDDAYTLMFTNDELMFECRPTGQDYASWETSTANLLNDVWYHYAITWNYPSSNLSFYLNGEFLENKTITTNDLRTTSNSTFIGMQNIQHPQYFDGIIDELRISSSVRNADWIKTTYYTTSDPNNFTAFGAQETPNVAPVLSSPSPSNGATGQNTNPTLRITVNDTDADSMNVTFWTNASGSWTLIGYNASVYNGTYQQIPSNMNEWSTTYYWSVNVTDGEAWTNTTYNFRTKIFNYVTYHFNAYSDTEKWATTPEYMVDNNTLTLSRCGTGTHIQNLTNNTCPGTNLGEIEKIEIRCYGDASDDVTALYLRPIFNGNTDGNNYNTDLYENTLPRWSNYSDITNDPNAPNPWTWADIQNLCMDVEANEIGTAGTCDVHAVQIRVNYSA